MDVVHGHHERCLVGVRTQQPPEPRRAAPVVDARGDVRELRYGAEEMEDGGERQRAVVGGAAGAQDAQAEVGRVRGGGLQDGGPAGARGPAQQDETAAPGADVLGLRRKQCVRVVAFPQRSGHRCLLLLSDTSDVYL